MTEHEQIITDVMKVKQQQRLSDKLDEYERRILMLEQVRRDCEEANKRIEQLYDRDGEDFKWTLRLATILLGTSTGLLVVFFTTSWL